MEITSKQEALDLLQILHRSCQEALDGDWDCTTDEGIEDGFTAMQTLLEALREFVLTPSTPLPVIKAFGYIKGLCPELSAIVFTTDERWHYLNEECKHIAFPDGVDVSILQDAIDSVDLPFIYQPIIMNPTQELEQILSQLQCAEAKISELCEQEDYLRNRLALIWKEVDSLQAKLETNPIWEARQRQAKRDAAEKKYEKAERAATSGEQ